MAMWQLLLKIVLAISQCDVAHMWGATICGTRRDNYISPALDVVLLPAPLQSQILQFAIKMQILASTLLKILALVHRSVLASPVAKRNELGVVFCSGRTFTGYCVHAFAPSITCSMWPLFAHYMKI